MKPRERILLGLFIITVPVTVLAIGGDIYRKARAEWVDKRNKTEMKLAVMEALVEDGRLWETRGDWLMQNQPKYTTRDTIDNHIFSTVKAAPSGVAVSDIKLIEAKETEHWIQAGVRLTGKGTLEDVFRWINQLQSPENFFVIKSLRVLPEKKTLNVIQCEIELVRWYAPQT